MERLQVEQNRIVDSQGQRVQLRGTCIGGWLNLENFINGYPGAEHSLRRVMAETLGPIKAAFFFERMRDYFLSEEDFALIKSTGANTVRLALNYRHFEDDRQPFKYLEEGFIQLNAALKWCAKYELYAILDLHAVQGWQNTDWHCDNANRQTLFWQHPHFQERFVALWQEFARRYEGNSIVAGYNLMNEPLCNAPNGRFDDDYHFDWDNFNKVTCQAVRAIREIDPYHIIFLEGDYFSTYFKGMDAPFAENLVYSSHNYTGAGFGPGVYPGEFWGQFHDRKNQSDILATHEGSQFCLQHNVPLWVGEFGSVFNGPEAEIPYRLQALDDQIAAFEEFGAHWTTWTYKDVGVMGWVELDPQCDYLQILAPVLEAKRQLHTDFWMPWLPPSPTSTAVSQLALAIENATREQQVSPGVNERYLTQAALDNYAGGLLQYSYARCFKGMSETELDGVLQSFAFKHCRPRQKLLEIVQKYF